MNKRNIDQMIPHAVQKLHSLVKGGSIDKVYSGYLSSFGPTVISSGILQTVMFYSADKNKNRVLKIMYELIQDSLKSDASSMETMLTQNENFKDYDIKNRILEANIACKLAIRTFDLKE